MTLLAPVLRPENGRVFRRSVTGGPENRARFSGAESGPFFERKLVFWPGLARLLGLGLLELGQHSMLAAELPRAIEWDATPRRRLERKTQWGYPVEPLAHRFA